MPDLTKPFIKVYDALRLVKLSSPTELNLYGDDGQLIETLKQGWYPDRTNEGLFLRVIDRDGIDFYAVTYFGWGGFRYERAGHPDPPTSNPRAWVWPIKPVGLDE